VAEVPAGRPHGLLAVGPARDGVDHRRRPLLVEFAGTPRAGKTTSIDRLSRLLDTQGCWVHRVEEQARDCPVRIKRDPRFNLWTASKTVVETIDACCSGADVILIDRGVFDALCWLDWYHRSGRLPTSDYERIDGWLRMQLLRDMIDLVVVMVVAPGEAERREFVLEPKRGSKAIVNKVTLKQFNHSIGAVAERCRDDFQLHWLDTTSSDVEGTVAHVSDIVGRVRYAHESAGHVGPAW
jgi:hypothetical protein